MGSVDEEEQFWRKGGVTAGGSLWVYVVIVVGGEGDRPFQFV